MSVFLGNFIKINETKWQALLTNNRPENFSEGDLNGGILLDSIPEQIIPEGKVLMGTFINPQTNEVWYEYIDAPINVPSPEEEIATLKSQVEALKTSLTEAQNAINLLLGV